MTTFNDRVNLRMKEMNLTQAELQRRTGWKQAHTNHVATGRSRMVNGKDIFALADALECDARWLALGDK